MNERDETDFAWHIGCLTALLNKYDIQEYLMEADVSESEIRTALFLLKSIAKKALHKK